MIYLFVFIVLISIPLIFRHPILGLIFIMATMPLDQRFSVPTNFGTLSVSNSFLIITLLSYFAFLMINSKTLSFTVSFLLVWAWYLSSISLGLGSGSSRMLITGLMAFLLVFIFTQIVRTKEQVRVLLDAYVWISLSQSLISLALYVTFFITGNAFGVFPAWFRNTFVPRAIGLHGDPNYLAISLFIGFGISLSKFAFIGSKRIINLLIAIAILTSIVLTFGRTAWISCSIISLGILFARFVRVKRIIITVSLVVFLFVFISFFLFPFFSANLVNELVELNASSVTVRYDTYFESYRILAENPLFGVGNSRATAMYAHNTYIYASLRSGLFGLVPLLALIVFPFPKNIKKLIHVTDTRDYSYVIGLCFGFLGVILGTLSMGIEGHKMLWISVALMNVTHSNISKDRIQ